MYGYDPAVGRALINAGVLRVGTAAGGVSARSVQSDDKLTGLPVHTGGLWSLSAGRQWLTPRLPKTGFSTPTTLTLLPTTFAGMCTGT